jgi:uncharacterized protein with von Willebrand factor type A (vWA) domain
MTKSSKELDDEISNYLSRDSRIEKISENASRIISALDSENYDSLQFFAHRIDDMSAGRRRLGVFADLIRYAEIVQKTRGSDKLAVKILRNEISNMNLILR